MGIYVRKVKQGTRIYHYLVTSYREGGKVKQKKLKYLGANPALEDVEKAKTEASHLLRAKNEVSKREVKKRWNR